MIAPEWFAVSALSSWAAGFPAYRLLARWKIVDRPNARSSHTRVTVRGGGIAIVAVVLCAALWIGFSSRVPLLLLLCAACALLASVSFLDDVRPLPARIRFGCQSLCAIAAVWALGCPSAPIRLAVGQSPDLAPLLVAALEFLWIAGYTNAFNFMDGINGIAAGQAALTAAASGALAGLATGHWLQAPVFFAFALSGAAAGFLPHNFPKARMFMGDVSSASLGFLLSAMVLWLARENGWWLLIPLGLLHANFVLDTTVTLLGRIARGERWYDSHQKHFYQRLIRSGKSHSFVTGWEMGIQIAVAAAMTAYLYAGSVFRCVLAAAVPAVWLGFMAYCEICFRTVPTARPPAQPAKLPS